VRVINMDIEVTGDEDFRRRGGKILKKDSKLSKKIVSERRRGAIDRKKDERKRARSRGGRVRRDGAANTEGFKGRKGRGGNFRDSKSGSMDKGKSTTLTGESRRINNGEVMRTKTAK